MPFTLLLKQMLPGLLPLFVFILVDEIWGTTAGLVTALAIGIAELAWTRIQEKRYDGFIVIDTVFLVIMGLVSLATGSAIFFKLKPAILELVVCLMFAAGAMYPEKYFLAMTSRYMKNITITVNDEAMVRLRRMMTILAAVFILHTALVVYSAFKMSEAAWGFISGGLFYIIFAVIMAGQILMAKLRSRTGRHK